MAVKPLLCEERLDALAQLIKSAPAGEIWECGVYQGGSALFIANQMIISNRTEKLRLFDSFTGIKTADPEKDNFHRDGDFGDVDFEEVRTGFKVLDFVSIHQGTIPLTFIGLEDCRIALAHIDVDVYNSVKSCLEFICSRIVPRGTIVLDDYGADTCSGAKSATDEIAIRLGLKVERGAASQAVIRF